MRIGRESRRGWRRGSGRLALHAALRERLAREYELRASQQRPIPHITQHAPRQNQIHDTRPRDHRSNTIHDTTTEKAPPNPMHLSAPVTATTSQTPPGGVLSLGNRNACVLIVFLLETVLLLLAVSKHVSKQPETQLSPKKNTKEHSKGARERASRQVARRVRNSGHARRRRRDGGQAMGRARAHERGARGE